MSIQVFDVNDTPNSLSFVPASTVHLRQSAGTVVGQLAAHDLNSTESLTCSGVGGGDGALFGTQDGCLMTLAPLIGSERDFQVVVRANNSDGLNVDLTVSVHAVSPSSLVNMGTMSDAIIEGSVWTGTVVGHLRQPTLNRGSPSP